MTAPAWAGSEIRSFSDPRVEHFRAEVREWLAGALPEGWREFEVTATEDQLREVRREWDRELLRSGYALLGWPAEYGGRAAGTIVETVFAEELARQHAPESLGRIGRSVVGPLLLDFGTDDQRRRLLPGILDASTIWCLGFSEPDAGSDLPNLSTRSTRDGDGYLVNGRKIWTSHAHYAQRCLLLTRTHAGPDKRSGITILMVDMSLPGITIMPIITAAGDHHFNEVVYESVPVPAADRLGPEDEGWPIFQHSLRYERGSTAALNHYMELSRWGGVLETCCAPRQGPAAMSRARDLSTRIDLVRWHILRGVEAEANDRPSGPIRMVLKLYWSELWQELTSTGLELSCAAHHASWQYQYLASLPGTIAAGTSEIQRNVIARSVLAASGARGEGR